MCGIIGYVGNQNAHGIVIDGLKRLEYRGYDSFGFAILKERNFEIFKNVGRISEFSSDFNGICDLSIGHTRWATHGGVTKENAHPHVDCTGKIIVVHNGIIDNFQELKQDLEKQGHVFKSQTDTEILPHLIEEHMKRGSSFEEAVSKSIGQLEGSYAFITAFSGEPDKLIGARNGAPLVVGLSDTGHFIASDPIAFLEHTKNAVFLDDSEIVILNGENAEFFKEGKNVEKSSKELEWDSENISKNGFEHYMLKEIHEQPLVLKQTLLQDKEKLKKAAEEVLNSRRVCIVACGTSRHAGLVGRYIISELAGKYCEVYMASEFQYLAPKDTLVIAVSQSGETADVLEGVKKAKEKGCKIISVVNAKSSTLDRESDISLYLNCGPEIAVASTKAFTSQVTLFYLLAYAMAGRLECGIEFLNEMPGKIMQTINETEGSAQNLANFLKDKNDIYFIARGENFAVATEGALKMKEVSYIHAEGMPAGELKHGTLALIEKGVPVVVICPEDHTHIDTLNNAMEVKARGGIIIGISNVKNEIFDYWLKIPKAEPIFYPILANIPCQLLAYYTALARGCDVDKPRNLAKSVTVK